MKSSKKECPVVLTNSRGALQRFSFDSVHTIPHPDLGTDPSKTEQWRSAIETVSPKIHLASGPVFHDLPSCLPACPSVCMSVCLCAGQSACLPVYLSVCLSFFLFTLVFIKTCFSSSPLGSSRFLCSSSSSPCLTQAKVYH